MALALGARARVVDGVLEIGWRVRPRHGPAGWLLRRSHFDAITLGHVVLAVDARAMWRWRQHERVHVRQYERWGALFFPLYLGASLWALARGGSAYRDNALEREAFAPPTVRNRRPGRRIRRRPSI